MASERVCDKTFNLGANLDTTQFGLNGRAELTPGACI